MKKITKKALAVLCAAVLTFSPAGCGEKSATGAESGEAASSGVGTDDQTGGVSALNGTWWYRAEPKEAAVSLNIFSFDGNAAVFYDPNGNEIIRGETKDNGDGTFVIQALDLFGDLECRIGQKDGGRTITIVEDGSVFLPGDPIDSAAAAENYTGKWYKSGDLNDEYVSINTDGSYAIYARVGDEDVAKEEGGWQLRDAESSDAHGRSKFQVIRLDTSFRPRSFTIAEDKTALWINDMTYYDYYLKESLIGGPEGERARQTVSLYCADLWRPAARETGAVYLKFYDDGSLLLQTQQADGSLSETGVGSWERTKDAFALTLPDGSKQAFTVGKEALTLEDGREFSRGV
ncbi:hypothetical protein [Caproiciproducens sp.]